MNLLRSILLCAPVAAFSMASSFAVGPAVFTESFDSDAANWADNGGASLSPYVATGGSDGGGYITSGTLTFADDFQGGFGPANAVLFRANDEYNASGDAFVGDWIDQHYVGLSFFVRHNAPVPVPFFARIATGTFPSYNQFGASTDGVTVPPNVWTEVTLNLSRNLNDISSFGGAAAQPDPYGFIFGDVHNVQIAALQPFGLTPEQLDDPVLFELDQVSLRIPEPGSILIAGLGCALFAMRIRKRRANG